MEAIIFTTAFDQFAIKAFEMNAVDYLLKPFSRDRFEAAVQKAMAPTPGMLAQQKAVADAAAFSLCRENHLPIVVFDLMTNGNIGRAVRGEKIGTLVS